jgi:hypothetical protein
MTDWPGIEAIQTAFVLRNYKISSQQLITGIYISWTISDVWCYFAGIISHQHGIFRYDFTVQEVLGYCEFMHNITL